jgi:hypothetical protein
MIKGTPINWFSTTLSKEQLIEQYKQEASEASSYEVSQYENIVNIKHVFIEKAVKWITGKMPHTIKYFSIPDYAARDMEICALAKMSGNVTTYMFTNNKEFADFVSKQSGFDIFEVAIAIKNPQG